MNLLLIILCCQVHNVFCGLFVYLFLSAIFLIDDLIFISKAISDTFNH
jgi:hypothetical protein